MAFTAAVVWLISVWWNYEPKSNEYISNALYDSMAYEIEYLKADKAALSDSIFALKVEKGFVEVQLNRSRSEVDKLIARTMKAKERKDTVGQLINCDSLIAELKERYLPTVDTFQIIAWAVDSMQQIKERYSDSIINKEYALRNVLVNDLATERINNSILRDKAKKKKRIALLAAIGGFITGMITTIAISK